MRKILSNTTFLAIIACLLWSSAFVGIKIGIEYTTPLQFAGVRFFISGLLILPFTGGLKHHLKVVREHSRIVLTIAFLNTFLQYTLFYTGLNLVPAALAAIVIGAGPLFIALMAHFMMPGDRMTPTKIFVFMLGFAGIILVSLGRNRFSDAAEVGFLGIILLLGVNIASGLGNVFVARDAGGIPPFILSSSSMIIGGAALFLFSLPIEGYNPGGKPIIYYGALGWLSFLSAAAISIWFTLLKRPGIKISNLNFWKFLIPVAGAILAWIILPAEHPTWIAISGMFVIALSLVALNVYRRRTELGFKEG
jgi:drug/metabolite transporter (DMT)-like permease